MTISREYLDGPFVVQCNDCSDTEELEGTERSEAVEDAKRRGYTAHFDGRRWTCGYCTKAAETAAEQAELKAFTEAEDRYEAWVNSQVERQVAA
jgi:hypothetical protein